MRTTSSPNRALVPLHALLLAVLSLAALPPAARSETFHDTTSVVVVEVPVTVTRQGRPVRGLAADQFELRDRGEEREIVGFEVVDLATMDPRSGPRTAADLPLASRRHFLLFFDLMNARPHTAAAAQDSARELLANLHPTDLVAVAFYLPTRGARFLTSFTTDRGEVERALLALSPPQLLEDRFDPVGHYVGELKAEQLTNLQPTLNVGNDGFSTLIWDEWALQLTHFHNSSNRETQMARVSAFTEELEAVARAVADLDGAKQVIFFSAGVERELLFGGDVRAVDTRRSLESGEIWNVDGDAVFGRTRVQNELEGVAEAFRRAGGAIQAIDIAGLSAERATARRSGADSLLALAHGTGGELYESYNRLGPALEKVLERTSVTYVLAFQAPDLEHDGSYRRLKVRLRGVPRGTRVAHRAGYYTPRSAGARAARPR